MVLRVLKLTAALKTVSAAPKTSVLRVPHCPDFLTSGSLQVISYTLDREPPNPINPNLKPCKPKTQIL